VSDVIEGKVKIGNLTFPFYRMPSILRNNSRFRRDQRQPPEEEEMWFNEEDDFEDVPTDTKITPDLDNSISE
jgi:hypothetical protein